MVKLPPPGIEPLKAGIQECPICGCDTRENIRYPRNLCPNCASGATSEDGRRLAFANIEISGGFMAWYADSEEPYESHICFVQGQKCWADEARFGGIVIQALRPGEERPPSFRSQ